MKITKLIFASTLSILVFQAIAYADFNSQGYPCVKDLCVGSFVLEEKIMKLPWIPFERDEALKVMKETGALSDDRLTYLAENLKVVGNESSKKELVLASLFQHFDSRLFAALSGTEICEPITLTGQYNSESELLTIVTIKSSVGINSETGEKGTGFLVTKIERFYTNQDANAIQGALTKEYPKLKITNVYEDGFAVFQPRGSRDIYSSPTLTLHAGEPTVDFDLVSLCKKLKDNVRIE